MTVINVTKNISGKELYPYAKIIVDEDVARKIVNERIVLGIVPNTGSIIILQRNGKTANKNNGGRSFAKLITGQSRVQRVKHADATDYRRTSFKNKKLPLASLLPTAPPIIDRLLQGVSGTTQQTTNAPRGRSVIDILKAKSYGGVLNVLAAPAPAPITKIAKPKRRRPVAVAPTPTNLRLASKRVRLKPNEVHIELANGSVYVGTHDAVIGLLKLPIR